jgi:hypothetical protein
MFDYLWRNFHVSFSQNHEEFFESEPTVPEENEQQQDDVIIELINNVMEEFNLEQHSNYKKTERLASSRIQMHCRLVLQHFVQVAL